MLQTAVRYFVKCVFDIKRAICQCYVWLNQQPKVYNCFTNDLDAEPDSQLFVSFYLFSCILWFWLAYLSFALGLDVLRLSVFMSYSEFRGISFIFQRVIIFPNEFLLTAPVLLYIVGVLDVNLNLLLIFRRFHIFSVGGFQPIKQTGCFAFGCVTQIFQKLSSIQVSMGSPMYLWNYKIDFYAWLFRLAYDIIFSVTIGMVLDDV